MYLLSAAIPPEIMKTFLMFAEPIEATMDKDITFKFSTECCEKRENKSFIDLYGKLKDGTTFHANFIKVYREKGKEGMFPLVIVLKVDALEEFENYHEGLTVIWEETAKTAGFELFEDSEGKKNYKLIIERPEERR